MARPILLIDLERCIGCHSCTVACKMENDLPVGNNWNQVLQVGPVGTFPDVKGYYLPVPCMHCADPACVKACPTGASYQREDKVVLIDHGKCIGCQYCTWACPYGARSFDPVAKVVGKCTLCVQLTDAGKLPACVTHCMGSARFYGDLDDPQSEVSKYLAANQSRAIHLLEDQGTKPGVVYLAPKCGMLADQVTVRS